MGELSKMALLHSAATFKGAGISPTDITDQKLVYRTRTAGDFPDKLQVTLIKESDVKYAENPGQAGAIYYFESIGAQQASKVAELTDLVYVRRDGKGKGGLSAINLMDICRAMEVLKYFREHSAAVIMKHNIVSGFADAVGFAMQERSRGISDGIFRTARECDRRSNFGGTFVSTYPLNMETAEALYELYGQTPKWFIDVIAAPGYEEGVVEFIEGKAKDVRLAQFSRLDVLPRFIGDETYGLLSFKEMPTGRMLVQELYLTHIRSIEDLVLRPKIVDKQGVEHVINYVPDSREARDLLTAVYINIAGARSNGVVAVRNGVAVSIGSGQVERVGAGEQMIIKGVQKAMDREGIPYDPLLGITGYQQLKDNPFKGASVSSDGFLPFDDLVRRLASVGVTVIGQPFGSINDAIVIDAANECGIAMPSLKRRFFGHW